MCHARFEIGAAIWTARLGLGLGGGRGRKAWSARVGETGGNRREEGAGSASGVRRSNSTDRAPTAADSGEDRRLQVEVQELQGPGGAGPKWVEVEVDSMSLCCCRVTMASPVSRKEGGKEGRRQGRVRLSRPTTLHIPQDQKKKKGLSCITQGGPSFFLQFLRTKGQPESPDCHSSRLLLA